MDQELITYFDARFTRIDEHFSQIDARFNQIDERFVRVDERFTQTSREIRETKETVGQLQITVESMRDDIRQVADGVAANDEKLNAFKGEVAAQFEEIRGLIRPAYGDLNRRVSALESWRERTDRDPTDMNRERFGKPKS